MRFMTPCLIGFSRKGRQYMASVFRLANFRVPIILQVMRFGQAKEVSIVGVEADYGEKGGGAKKRGIGPEVSAGTWKGYSAYGRCFFGNVEKNSLHSNYISRRSPAGCSSLANIVTTLSVGLCMSVVSVARTILNIPSDLCRFIESGKHDRRI